VPLQAPATFIPDCKIAFTCQMVYFQTKKSKFWEFLNGFTMEEVGLFYEQLVYFITIWYILWKFGIF
jgi:hypothetical protein